MSTGTTTVACFGECMLELQGQAFGTMQQSFGGDTLNTAVYLARCGAAHGPSFHLKVQYATALGDDPLSTGLIERWQAEGVRTDWVRRLPGRMPGLYLIEVDEGGERRFSYWRGEAAARDYFAAPEGSTPLERAVAQGQLRALYVSGISLAIVGPAGRARLLALAQILQRQGGVIAFDNNYRPRLWPHRQEAQTAFAQFTAASSIALLTLDDECALWSLGAQGAAQRVRALATPEVVLKRGAEATWVRNGPGGDWLSVPAIPVTKVVDTTAAGDSFAGAYLAARLAGQNPAAAALAGNQLAAQVIQHRGAIMPADAAQHGHT